MRNVISLVLGGGRGTRLVPLTLYRSKPAVPLAGKYRLIDIPLSNCINSGLKRIYVLTQFMSVSLHRHIRQTYIFDHFEGGFVELLAAQQTMDEGTDWYQGTADAVRKNLRYIEQPGVEHVLVLSGDQLYRMDYRNMLKKHIEADADVSIATMPVTREDAKSLGIMRADDRGQVTGFLEKPQTHEEMDVVRMNPAWIDGHGIESGGRDCLASMGIYLFKRQVLVDALTKTNYQDFGREIFPAAIHSKRVQAYLFDGYWEDIGTIKAFYDANLSLCRPDAPFDLWASGAPIFTRARMLPPAMMDGATVKNSIIADGSRIGEGAVIENSIIGLRSIIGKNVTIRNSIVMGADFYDRDVGSAQVDEGPSRQTEDAPPIGIGDDTLVEGAIVDKNCRLGRGVRIVKDDRADTDVGDIVMVRDGIPVVLKDAVVPDGWKM